MSKKKKSSLQIQPISFSNYILKNARKLDLFKCWKSDTSAGMGHFVVARKRKNGTLVVGVYLIDLYCLGLKDTFYSEFEDLEDLKEKLLEAEPDILNFEEIDSSLCFNYIYGAIEYAEDLGFQPHKDFKTTEYILDDVEDIDFVDIEFGYNGKPMFVAGPSDNVNRILSVLDKNVGEGNYKCIIGHDDEDSEDDDEYFEDFYEELEEFKELSDEEFQQEIELSFLKYSDEVKPIYGVFLLINMALQEWKRPEQYRNEYKIDSKKCINQAVKYLKPKLPKEISEGNLVENFAILSIENTIKFEGAEFILLEAFQKAFEAFQKEELVDNYAIITTFLIPLEFRRMQDLMGIRAYLSEELYQEGEFENLNSFQTNRVADVLIETLVDYEQEGLITQQYEDIEDTLDDYLSIAEYMPDLSQKELKNMIMTMVMPEVPE